MRRLATLALLLVVASAGLAEPAGGHLCCQSEAATAPKPASPAAHLTVMAMPCCPQPCKLRPATAALPPATEIAAQVRWPASGARPQASSLPQDVSQPRLAALVGPGTRHGRPLRTRSPRDGLALLSTLLL